MITGEEAKTLSGLLTAALIAVGFIAHILYDKLQTKNDIIKSLKDKLKMLEFEEANRYKEAYTTTKVESEIQKSVVLVLRNKLHEAEQKYDDLNKSIQNKIQSIQNDYTNKRIALETTIRKKELEYEDFRNSKNEELARITRDLKRTYESKIKKNTEQHKLDCLQLQDRSNVLAEKLNRSEKKAQQIQDRASFLESMLNTKDSPVIQNRQWLMGLFAELTKLRDDVLVETLRTKRNPAIKASEKLAEVQAEKRTLLERAKQLEYQLKTYEEYFPFLVDYQLEILNDEIKPADDMDLVKDSKGEDPDIVRKYISADEYKSLTSAQRNQLALDRYLSGNLSKLELGRLYERYIGYTYEQKGYSVEYTGIEKGLEDLGQDLICTKGMSTIVIQAKCWSQTKLIREKHILQLFATTLLRKIGSNPEREYTSILITSTKLSDVAKTVAQALGVQYKEEVPLDKGYPLIKCNINQTTKEKIYHLPFDQMYDKVKIEPQLGEHYVATTKEAEAKGFRRAFKYRGV